MGVGATTVIWSFDACNAAAARDARRAFRRRLEEEGVTPEAVAAAELAFGELIGNVARHAPGPVRVRTTVDEVAVLEVWDTGPGFRPRERDRERHGDQPQTLTDNGRGLALVRAVAKDVRVSTGRREGGSYVRAELPIREPV